MTWEQNLRALRRRAPDLAQALEQAQPTPGINLMVAKSGDPVPVWQDRPLYSRFDPRREAEAWASGIFDATPHFERVYLIFGLGLGYHLEALIKKDPQAFFVVFETDLDWWRRLLQLRDIRALIKHQRVLIQAAPDFGLNSTVFQTVSQGVMAGSVQVVEIPAYRDLFPEAHADWSQSIINSLRHLQVALVTREHWKDQWLQNSIANLIEVFANPGVADLQGRLKDTPALMVAAGPSLNEHFEVLKTLTGRVPIVALGSGLRVLRKAGIVPDYFVTIEPSPHYHDKFKEYYHPDTTLVFFSSTNPLVPQHYPGNKISAFADQELLPRWLGQQLGWNKGTLPDASSVAIPTFNFILHLGCPEIILLGQDFSTTDTDQVYARGLPNPAAGYDHFFPQTNVSGHTVYTTKPLVSMRREIEAFVDQANQAHRRVYNASRTGLPIRGADSIDFAAWAREQGNRHFTRPELAVACPSRAEVVENLRDPLDDLRRELLNLRDLTLSAAVTLEPLQKLAATDRMVIGRRLLQSAVPTLNQAMESAAYKYVIQRTVDNLDSLVRNRHLRLDSANDAQIRAFVALLYNLATSIGGRAECYHDVLGKVLPD